MYAAAEPFYNTEFWRKLETILAVAGRGLYVDDYMVFHRDRDIHYPPEMYKRLNNGIAKLGGSGKYIRSVTLALATAIFTDGLHAYGRNENEKTSESIAGYKAWALRTISEGAYSSEHCAMMQGVKKIDTNAELEIDFERFRTIVFWEAYVSNSSFMVSDWNYLDMSIQQSNMWKPPNRKWDGIIEWLGMENCFKMNESTRSEINNFLSSHVNNSTWTSTSGHVAVLLQLSCVDHRNDRLKFGNIRLKRNIAVQLSRFSSGKRGYVTAVAEATGLWNMNIAYNGYFKQILPWYLRHVPCPEDDQTAEITDSGVLNIYKRMEVRFLVSGIYWRYLLGSFSVYILAIIVTAIFVPTLTRGIVHLIISGFFSVFWVLGTLLLILISIYRFLFRDWPWVDYENTGEAVFDNLIMHGIFDSLVNKKKYKALEVAPYDKLSWH